MKLVIVSAVSVADIAIVGWAWENTEELEGRGSRFGEETPLCMLGNNAAYIYACASS